MHLKVILRGAKGGGGIRNAAATGKRHFLCGVMRDTPPVRINSFLSSLGRVGDDAARGALLDRGSLTQCDVSSGHRFPLYRLCAELGRFLGRLFRVTLARRTAPRAA